MPLLCWVWQAPLPCSREWGTPRGCFLFVFTSFPGWAFSWILSCWFVDEFETCHCFLDHLLATPTCQVFNQALHMHSCHLMVRQPMCKHCEPSWGDEETGLVIGPRTVVSEGPRLIWHILVFIPQPPGDTEFWAWASAVFLRPLVVLYPSSVYSQPLKTTDHVLSIPGLPGRVPQSLSQGVFTGESLLESHTPFHSYANSYWGLWPLKSLISHRFSRVSDEFLLTSPQMKVFMQQRGTEISKRWFATTMLD